MPPCLDTDCPRGIENEIYIKPEKPFIMEKGAGELMFDGLTKHSENIALIDAVTGETETCGTLLSKSIRTAQNLKLKGIKEGDIVSLCTYNNMDYSAATLGIFFIGAVNAPMDPTCPLRDITHCLKITAPKLIFCEPELENTIEKAMKDAGLSVEIVVFGETENNVPFTDYLIPREPEDTFEIYKIKDFFETCCIHFSSGTTGLPKAVCVSNYGLCFVVFLIVGDFSKIKTSTCATSPFWISNMNNLISSIVCGATRVIIKMFDEKTIMKHVEEHKINVLSITPVNGMKLIEHPEYCNYDQSALMIIGTGGSPTPPQQFLDYAELFPKAIVISGYGMTESGGLILKMIINNTEEIKKTNKTCIGVPIPDFRYRVVDPETEEILGPNQEGELRFTYGGIMKAYYGNPKAYAEAFDSNGFLKTGDIVYYDEDKRFYYVTRIKDIFKYMGWHISPVLIENELLTHPNIKEAAVFGVPSKSDGEYATAAVIVHDKTKFNEQEIIEYIKERLPERYHLRGGVIEIDCMPTTSTGKMQRRKLTAIVQNLKK